MRHLTLASILAIPVVALFAQTARAEDLVFTLKNASSSPLTEFYVETMDTKSWGENILHGTVQAGESGEVTIADGKTTCKYGIKGTFADGSTLEEENLNLCELGSYTYHNK